jgi:hypothetical protein
MSGAPINRVPVTAGAAGEMRRRDRLVRACRCMPHKHGGVSWRLVRATNQTQPLGPWTGVEDSVIRIYGCSNITVLQSASTRPVSQWMSTRST